MTLRETIKEITREHLEENNGAILGQCLSAVGWVNGTVPSTKNIIELPMTDVAGAGFAVGMAVAGRRPIFVLRFGDFITLNMSPIVNFAAKQKDIWGKSAPLFVRLISQEGKGAGPSHSGKMHSIMTHFPGLKVWCPITPKEYLQCWSEFMSGDEPMICCEHRSTYDIVEPSEDMIEAGAEVTIFAISLARVNAFKAYELLKAEGIKCNFIHIYKLKPFCALDLCSEALKGCRVGLVVDSGFETCSFARDLAYQLMLKSGVRVQALGLKDVSVGCSLKSENSTPSVIDIASLMKELLHKEGEIDAQI